MGVALLVTTMLCDHTVTLCLETFFIVKTGFVDDVGRFSDFFYTHRPSVQKVFSIILSV